MTAPARSSYVDKLNAQGAVPWLKEDASVLVAKIFVRMSDFNEKALGPLATAFTSNDPLDVAHALSPTFVSETFERFPDSRAAKLLSLDLRSMAQLAFVNIDQLSGDLDGYFERMQHALVLIDACDASCARSKDAFLKHFAEPLIQGGCQLHVRVVLEVRSCAHR